MLQYDMSAKVRSNFGKGASRSLRREGMIPAILYGPKTEAVALQVDTKTFTKSLIDMQRRNAVFTLDIENDDASGKRHALVKDIQTNPITDVLVHADFYEVSLQESIELQVQVDLVGKAKGVDAGGEIHVHNSIITLKGIILDIPDSIEIDISDLDVGDRINCGDATIPTGIELVSDAEETLVSIQMPSAGSEEEEAEETEETTEAAADESAGEESE